MSDFDRRGTDDARYRRLSDSDDIRSRRQEPVIHAAACRRS